MMVEEKERERKWLNFLFLFSTIINLELHTYDISYFPTVPEGSIKQTALTVTA